jgi:hypothetical protein
MATGATEPGVHRDSTPALWAEASRGWCRRLGGGGSPGNGPCPADNPRQHPDAKASPRPKNTQGGEDQHEGAPGDMLFGSGV